MHDHERALRDWCMRIDWLHVHAVVAAGCKENQRIWDILREYRSDLHIWLFEPRPEVRATLPAEMPDWVQVADTIVALRMQIVEVCRGNWRIETVGEPEIGQKWGREVSHAVDEASRYVASMQVTARENAMPWTEAGIAMLEHLPGRVPLPRIKDAISGVPALVIGAGPSLAEQIEHVAKLKGRALLVAVASACGALAKHGIVPDVVATVEAREHPLDKLRDLDFWRDVVLMHGSHCHPIVHDIKPRAVVPALQGIGAIGPWLLGIEGIEGISTGGSVGTLAFSIAQVLGCRPIAMVGMDCAFRDDTGKSIYADGVVRPDGEVYNHTVERCPAWGGLGTVPTIWSLYSYGQWFESRASAATINCSEGGARINGWTELPLRAVADRWISEFAVRDLVGDIIAATGKAEPFSALRIIDGLEQQITESETLITKAREAEDCIAALCNKLQEVADLPYGIANGAGLAPIAEFLQHPQPNQLHALGNTMHTFGVRAERVVELIRATIARMRDTHARAA